MQQTYWDVKLETLPIERRTILRDHRLRWQVRRCWDNSPFYRARLARAGVDPAAFNGLADLEQIPILRADDLPHGDVLSESVASWTVAPEDWWRDRESSDLLGPRILTEGDLTYRADLAARALWAAGVRPGDTVTLPDTTDAALGAGMRRVGAAQGEGDVASRRAFAIPPALTCVVAYGCEAEEGLHLADDHVLFEVADPADGTPVAFGGEGVLIVTDLTREGSPLIRFWTDHRATLTDALCPCGRTSVRATFLRPLP